MKTKRGIVPLAWVGIAVAFAGGILLVSFFLSGKTQSSVGTVSTDSKPTIPALPKYDAKYAGNIADEPPTIPSGFKTYSNPEYGISFEYLAKYTLATPAGYEAVLPLLQYKDPNKTMPDFIDVKWFSVKSGENIEQAMIQDVFYDGSGMHPKSFDDFSLMRLGENDFYKIRTGLFEGVLGYRYYLVRDGGAFVFTLTANAVPWTDPLYNPEKEPRHDELREMLKTVRINI